MPVVPNNHQTISDERQERRVMLIVNSRFHPVFEGRGDLVAVPAGDESIGERLF